MADQLDIDLSGAGPMPETDPQTELKRRLAKRMAFALVMIAVLLGALAVFDRLSQSGEEELAPVARPPVPLPRHELAQPLKPPAPVESAAARIGTEAVAVSADKTSVVVPTPGAEPPPKPVVLAQPSVGPATAPAAVTRPEAPPPAVAARPAATPPAAVAEGSAAPVASTPPVAPPVTPPPVAPRAAPPRLFSGYALQAGVFTSARHAEELLAKLQLNGIPSTLEARVQAGPFKSRAEAEAARDKLKSLGIESVLIPPRDARR